ncbi:MAG TPA: hypothetical protein PLL39_17040, partial [Rhodocyclaceae bacterium]|nr:hypothetical protein [Rhodocyclaceae bacterium]
MIFLLPAMRVRGATEAAPATQGGHRQAFNSPAWKGSRVSQRPVAAAIALATAKSTLAKILVNVF